MILLDTNVVLAMAEAGDVNLGPEAIRAVESEQDDLVVSSISAWEISMLVDKRRISLSMPIGEWMDRLIARAGLRVVPVTVALAIDAGALPGGIHGDPADRFMVATARAIGCPLLTADRKILAYAAAGHLQAIDARR